MNCWAFLETTLSQQVWLRSFLTSTSKCSCRFKSLGVQSWTRSKNWTSRFFWLTKSFQKIPQKSSNIRAPSACASHRCLRISCNEMMLKSYLMSSIHHFCSRSTLKKMKCTYLSARYLSPTILKISVSDSSFWFRICSDLKLISIDVKLSNDATATIKRVQSFKG